MVDYLPLTDDQKYLAQGLLRRIAWFMGAAQTRTKFLQGGYYNVKENAADAWGSIWYAVNEFNTVTQTPKEVLVEAEYLLRKSKTPHQDICLRFMTMEELYFFRRLNLDIPPPDDERLAYQWWEFKGEKGKPYISVAVWMDYINDRSNREAIDDVAEMDERPFIITQLRAWADKIDEAPLAYRPKIIL